MNLANYLKQQGLTQGEFAEILTKDSPAATVTQSSVSQWLKSGVPPKRVWQLERVSEGLMTQEELLTDSNHV
jgi:predicted transcriptional regulator